MHNQRHPTTPSVSLSSAPKPKKSRGSYVCGRCGQPKKGHNCLLSPPQLTASNNTQQTASNTNLTASNTIQTASNTYITVLNNMPRITPRRALSFSDDESDLAGNLTPTGKIKVAGDLAGKVAIDGDFARKRKMMVDGDLDGKHKMMVAGESAGNVNLDGKLAMTGDLAGKQYMMVAGESAGKMAMAGESAGKTAMAGDLDGKQKMTMVTGDLLGEMELGGEMVVAGELAGKVNLTGDMIPELCIWEVMKRMAVSEVMGAARVCRRWREVTRRVWKEAVEIRVRVPKRVQSGMVGGMLSKCEGLVRLTLTMESDLDATMLACIAFSCPNLESLEIFMSGTSLNRITGDELGRFVADRKCLNSLKMEGCSYLGGFVLSSTCLSTLWLSGLHCLSKMVFNCPSLREISLDFSRQESDYTDLTAMADGLGRGCPRLQNIHIASMRLSNAVVLALTAVKLRGLRMLSLVLGSEITDASVAAISSSYSKLELLDLSGSSITDSGIGMICNVFPNTLTKFLLALCPNITSSGIQFAAAQLPLLELMDCGMTICDPDSMSPTSEDNTDHELPNTPKSKLHSIYQKLLIKHGRLKKLSLWGCSGLDALYLNCPELNDLNLNSCSNLQSERLSLQCPNLETVHALGCQDILIETLQNQVSGEYVDLENQFPRKRSADGSKRIRVPHHVVQRHFEDDKIGKWKRFCKRPYSVIIE